MICLQHRFPPHKAQKKHAKPKNPHVKIILLRVVPTMRSLKSHIKFYVRLIRPGEGRHTTQLLKCVRLLSTILSEISFGYIFRHIF